MVLCLRLRTGAQRAQKLPIAGYFIDSGFDRRTSSSRDLACGRPRYLHRWHCRNDDCYAVVQWTPKSPSGVRGAFGALTTVSLEAPVTEENQFVCHSMWVNDGAASGYWIEAGVFRGQLSAQHGFNANYEYYYAEQTAGSGYKENIFPDSHPVLSQPIEVQIAYSGTGKDWNVSLDNNIARVQQAITSPSHDISTGIESTQNDDSGYGSSSSLGYYDLAGGSRDGWSGSTHAVDSSTHGSSTVWVNPYKWAREYLNRTP